MVSLNTIERLHEYRLFVWYFKLRFPRLSNLSGGLAVRELVSIAEWAKHAIIYEVTSTNARKEKILDHESSNCGMEQWTGDLVRLLDHAPGPPNLAKLI
jgi:hypothetical protein